MNTHNFHLLITDYLKPGLNNIRELNQYSFSGKIKFVLHKVDKIVNNLNKFNINEKSKAEYLNTRKKVHIYIEEKLYKKIKYYHRKLNSYSIAQLVRIILRIFLKMVKEYGY